MTEITIIIGGAATKTILTTTTAAATAIATTIASYRLCVRGFLRRRRCRRRRQCHREARFFKSPIGFSTCEEFNEAT